MSKNLKALRKSVGLLPVLFVALLIGCGDDGDNGGAAPTATATGAPVDTATPVPTASATASEPTATPRPASFEVRSSILQLYVTGADAGAALELLDADGDVIAAGPADEEGTRIFRDLAAGSGYRVASGAGAERVISDPVDVWAPEDTPDPSFYESQEIGAGYGYLETRDGTLLSINVVLPGPIEDGPYPTVIEYSGYDPANPDAPQPSTTVANLLGYAAVGVNMRGTGCSGGAFQFFEPPQSTDGYDAVEVIAAQPWVKGNKVGMVGVSYPGITQLFVGRLRPPHLAAIAPLSVISDTFRGTLYPGGILNDGFAVEWALERQHDATPGGQAWSQKRIDEGDEVCIANQKLRGQTPDLLEMIRENAFYNPVVADPLAPANFVDRIDVPVFLGGAWQDEQTGGYFATMLDRFTGTDRVHFTLTNGGHTDSLGPALFGRWAEFLSFYVAEEIPSLSATERLLVQVLGQEIFGVGGLEVEPDRYTDVASFEEARGRFESEPPVRVLFENGAGDPEEPGAPVPSFEMSFGEWPVPEVEPAIWYFGADGRLQSEAPSDDGADSYVYDPARAQVSTCPTCDGQEDYWQALPAWEWLPLAAGTAAAYATEPLDEDLVMVGSGSVDLWLSSTAADTDLQVTLSDIRPDGQEAYVQSGWIRASRRKLAAEATELRPVHTHLEADAAPLPAGEPSLVRVEIFPFAHVFRAGSRVRIALEAPGGSRPRWKFEALPAEGEVINTIARSAAAPSRIVLPVIPGVEAPAAQPPCPGLRAQPCRSYEEHENSPG